MFQHLSGTLSPVFCRYFATVCKRNLELRGKENRGEEMRREGRKERRRKENRGDEERRKKRIRT